MRPSTDAIKGGYLYRMVKAKYDIVGERYKLNLRKFWIDYYSRKTSLQYGVVYTEMSIFVSKDTPLVRRTLHFNEEDVVKKLTDNWFDIFEYAITKAEPGWITYSESDKFTYDPCEKEDAIKRLDVSPEEFERIRKKSPYS